MPGKDRQVTGPLVCASAPTACEDVQFLQTYVLHKQNNSSHAASTSTTNILNALYASHQKSRRHGNTFRCCVVGDQRIQERLTTRTPCATKTTPARGSILPTPSNTFFIKSETRPVSAPIRARSRDTTICLATFQFNHG